ncbi:MAG: amino acid permease [Bryobacterales bacterium]|nr:amino acid permease [Bryobacterales bacterium]
MSNMVGVGPFITIPMIIAAMGGPQCMLGWALGAILALCDGMVWAELAAAMPGSGGTFVYLREAFERTRIGRLMPFLFIWQFIFSGPLEIASGFIGFTQYVSYFWRTMGPVESKLVTAGIGVAILLLLYRDIREVGKLTVVLWAGMLITVVAVIASGFIHFDTRKAFDYPPNAFTFSQGFFLGLGSAMLIAMYDFLGYYDVCYVAGEVRNPERVLPRSIIVSVITVALIYAAINLSIMGLVPWREAMQSKFIASEFMERAWGGWAGSVITIMILWTCLASVFALMLGFSRIPYAAALDGFFFHSFSRLHPTGKFPYISLLTVGGLSILGGMLSLDWVVSALMTARIVVQFMGQIVAVHMVRTRRLDIERPYRMWLYPLPSLIAFAGWLYVFGTSGWTFVLYGLGTLVLGVIAFLLWDRRHPAVPE